MLDIVIVIVVIILDVLRIMAVVLTLKSRHVLLPVLVIINVIVNQDM